MSATVKVITNSFGECNRVIVYETQCGTVVFDSNYISPRDLFYILNSVNGMADEIKYVQLTDEEMLQWEEHS